MTTVSNCTLESAAQRVGACRQPPLAPIGGEALVGSQELAESIVAGGGPFVPLCCVVPTLFGIGDEAGGQYPYLAKGWACPAPSRPPPCSPAPRARAAAVLAAPSMWWHLGAPLAIQLDFVPPPLAPSPFWCQGLDICRTYCFW